MEEREEASGDDGLLVEAGAELDATPAATTGRSTTQMQRKLDARRAAVEANCQREIEATTATSGSSTTQMQQKLAARRAALEANCQREIEAEGFIATSSREEAAQVVQEEAEAEEEEEEEDEALLEDESEYTIFEDLEDEVQHCRDRSAKLAGALRRSRRAAERLNEAGYHLQKEWQALKEDYREAFGEIAYWREVAEIRKEELTMAEARADAAQKEAASAIAAMNDEAARTASQPGAETHEKENVPNSAPRRCPTATPPTTPPTKMTPLDRISPSAMSPHEVPVSLSPLEPTPATTRREKKAELAQITPGERRRAERLEAYSEETTLRAREEAATWRRLAERRGEELEGLRLARPSHTPRSLSGAATAAAAAAAAATAAEQLEGSSPPERASADDFCRAARSPWSTGGKHWRQANPVGRTPTAALSETNAGYRSPIRCCIATPPVASRCGTSDVSKSNVVSTTYSGALALACARVAAAESRDDDHEEAEGFSTPARTPARHQGESNESSDFFFSPEETVSTPPLTRKERLSERSQYYDPHATRSSAHERQASRRQASIDQDEEFWSSVGSSSVGSVRNILPSSREQVFLPPTRRRHGNFDGTGLFRDDTQRVAARAKKAAHTAMVSVATLANHISVPDTPPRSGAPTLGRHEKSSVRKPDRRSPAESPRVRSAAEQPSREPVPTSGDVRRAIRFSSPTGAGSPSQPSSPFHNSGSCRVSTLTNIDIVEYRAGSTPRRCQGMGAPTRSCSSSKSSGDLLESSSSALRHGEPRIERSNSTNNSPKKRLQLGACSGLTGRCAASATSVRVPEMSAPSRATASKVRPVASGKPSAASSVRNLVGVWESKRGTEDADSISPPTMGRHVSALSPSLVDSKEHPLTPRSNPRRRHGC